jgi:hypothetical protein
MSEEGNKMIWKELIGLKVVAFRGYKSIIYGKSKVQLHYVLFDDKETFLEFSEQDPYSYHDCSSSARILDLQKNASLWQSMFNKEGSFVEYDGNAHDPF